eukprot:7190104-Alexandrium_andersonii.AAC.1
MRATRNPGKPRSEIRALIQPHAIRTTGNRNTSNRQTAIRTPSKTRHAERPQARTGNGGALSNDAQALTDT